MRTRSHPWQRSPLTSSSPSSSSTFASSRWLCAVVNGFGFSAGSGLAVGLAFRVALAAARVRLTTFHELNFKLRLRRRRLRRRRRKLHLLCAFNFVARNFYADYLAKFLGSCKGGRRGGKGQICEAREYRNSIRQTPIKSRKRDRLRLAHWLIKPNNCLFAEREGERERGICNLHSARKMTTYAPLQLNGRARLINHPRLVANSTKLFTQPMPIAESNGSQPALQLPASCN